MSFWTEIKRRKVVQVAAVYAITAWLLVQVIVSIEAPLNLPPWSDTLIIVLLAIGFPIALILSWAFDLTPDGLRATPDAAPAAPRAPSPHWLNFAIQALVLAAVGFLLVEQYLGPGQTVATGAPGNAARVPGSGPAERYSILAPPDALIAITGSPVRALAISPAGDAIAYVSGNLRRGPAAAAAPSRPPGIAIRRLGSRATELLTGDEAREQPFFSPDGRWIGYFTRSGEMQKLLLGASSSPVTITTGLNSPQWTFAVWHDNGQIYFADVSGDPRMFAVSAEGGTPVPVTEVDPLNPEILPLPGDFVPTTGAVLLTSFVQRGDQIATSLQTYDPASGERHTIIDNAEYPWYVDSGHLIFHRAGTTLVAPFDAVTRSLTGPAIPLNDVARLDTSDRVPQFAVSRSGVLAYLPEIETPGELALVDRNGNIEPIDERLGNYTDISVSPDGARAAITEIRSGARAGERILIYDFGRGDLRPFTEQGDEHSPEWRPDGAALSLYSRQAERRGLIERNLNGAERLLVPHEELLGYVRNASWHPLESLLAYTLQSGGEHDIWIARIGDDAVVTEPLLTGPGNEFSPRFSADGHWLAYSEDGNVYVMAFPDGEPAAVSDGGAFDPRWSKTGPELYFAGSADGRPMLRAVSVGGAADRPDLGNVENLFPLIYPNEDGSATFINTGGNSGAGYDVLPDGRFLMVRRANVAPPQEIAVTRNWLGEIEGL